MSGPFLTSRSVGTSDSDKSARNQSSETASAEERTRLVPGELVTSADGTVIACNNNSRDVCASGATANVYANVAANEIAQFDLTLLGTDQLSDPHLDEIIDQSQLKVNPVRLTPKSGYNFGRLKQFALCRENLKEKSGKVLFVTLPTFSTAAGNRQCITKLRNLCELIRVHLVNEDRHLIIDAAAGNPAWKQPCILDLLNHRRLTHGTSYFWCSAGALVEGKSHKRHTKVASTFPLEHVKAWTKCCGKTSKDHWHGRRQSDDNTRFESVKIPMTVMKSFLADITLIVTGKTCAVNEGVHHTHRTQDESYKHTRIQTESVDVMNSTMNHDHIRHDDPITVDEKTGTLTRPQRVFITKDQADQEGPFECEEVYPLQTKKNRKPVNKRPIVWPNDDEKKAQGQSADCGEDFGGIDDVDDTELMDCEFREDTLQQKSKEKKDAVYRRQQDFKRRAHFVYNKDADEMLLSQLDSILDTTYLAIGMRGSGNLENWLPHCPEPPKINEFDNICSKHAMYHLVNGESDDIIEFFGGKGGVTKVAVRRKLKCGEVVDLVYGFDLSRAKERTRWTNYVKHEKPRVVIMGPPCTHFGPLSNINKRYASFQDGYEVSVVLADFAAQLAHLQLSAWRDFIAENPQSSNIWNLPSWQKVLKHPRTVVTVHDQCMSGLKIPDRHNNGTPILCRKSTKFVASRWCLIKLLDQRCDHDLTREPHGRIEGNWKGKPISKCAQEWPPILCKKIVSGVERTIREQKLEHSWYYPVGEEAEEGVSDLICDACQMGLPPHHTQHTRDDDCVYSMKDFRKWVECKACKHHQGKDYERTNRKGETVKHSNRPFHCLLAHKNDPKIFPQLLKARREHGTGDEGHLPRLPSLREVDNTHGGPPAIEDEEELWLDPSQAPFNPEEDDALLDEDGVVASEALDIVLQSDGAPPDIEDRGRWTPGRTEPQDLDEGRTSPQPVTPPAPWNRPGGVSLNDPFNNEPASPRDGMYSPSSPAHSVQGEAVENPGEPAVQIAGDVEPVEPENAEAVPGEGVSLDQPEGPPVAPVRPARRRRAMADAGTQAGDEGDTPEWSAFDVGVALNGLRNGTDGVRRKILRRLHVRWWHASFTKMCNILQQAGISKDIQKLCKDIVGTCKICRKWTKVENKPMAKTRMSTSFNECIQVDVMFWKGHYVLHTIDECTRYSMLSFMKDKTTKSLCQALNQSWFRTFSPPQVILVDQEGGLASDSAGVFLERHGVSRKPKPTDLHASIVERHHQVVRDMLHKIEGQCEKEKLIVDDSDILSECCYAKNCMMNVGGFNPITSVLGIKPQVLPDSETTTLSVVDDMIGRLDDPNRACLRLREMSVAAMINATARNRLSVAERTQTRRDGREHEFKLGDLVDVYRKQDGHHAKDRTGWRGPCTVVDLTEIERGQLSVKWNGSVMLASSGTTRPHAAYPVLVMYNSLREPSYAMLLQEAAHASIGKPTAYAWYWQDKWKLTSAAKKDLRTYLAGMKFGMQGLNVHGCIGVRVGKSCKTLTKYPEADASTVIIWTPSSTIMQDVDPRQDINMKEELFRNEDDWKNCAFIQVLSIDDQEWTNTLRVDIPTEDTPPKQPPQPTKDEAMPDVPQYSDDVNMPDGPDDEQDWWNDDPPGPPPGPPSGPQNFIGGYTPSPKRGKSEQYRIDTPRDWKMENSDDENWWHNPDVPPPPPPPAGPPRRRTQRFGTPWNHSGWDDWNMNESGTGDSPEAKRRDRYGLDPYEREENPERFSRHPPNRKKDDIRSPVTSRARREPDESVSVRQRVEQWQRRGPSSNSHGPASSSNQAWNNSVTLPIQEVDEEEEDDGVILPIQEPEEDRETEGYPSSPEPEEKRKDYFIREEELLCEEFAGIVFEQDREKLSDIRHQCAYLAEMLEQWDPERNVHDVADDYSSEWEKSYRTYNRFPDLFTQADAKHAAYLVNQHRNRHNDILEMEIPYYYLDEEAMAELGRTPDENECVVLQLDRRTGGMSYLIEQDLPELNAKDVKENQKLVDAAVAAEWASWNDNNSFWPILRSKSTNIIDTRWVHKWKIIDGKRSIKSRLCARGFKDRDGDTLETSASTATRWAQRLVISTAVNHGWTIMIADVKCAFLKGMTFEEIAELTGTKLRKVEINPPRDSWRFLSAFQCMKGCNETTHILGLNKPVYGLKDAPRAWRIKLDIVLRGLLAVPMKEDPSLYMWHERGKLVCLATTHVDDLKMCGDDHVVDRVIKGLEKELGKMKLSYRSFEHCGFMHEQLPNGDIKFHQNHYIARLSQIPVPKHVDLESSCSDHDASAYITLLGGLGWVVNSRADVAVFCGALQRCAKSPKYVDMKRLNTVIKYIKKHPVVTLFRKLSGPLRVVAISDSAFRRQDESALACRGSMIVLGMDHLEQPGGLIHVIDFQSKKQKRVTRSTYGAELHGLADTLELARIIALAFTELYHGAKTHRELDKLEHPGQYHFPLDACLDAKSVFESIIRADLKLPDEKTLVHVLGQCREHMQWKRIRILWWIDTRDMLADGLNKGAIRREAILKALIQGVWPVQHKCEKRESKNMQLQELLDDETIFREASERYQAQQ